MRANSRSAVRTGLLVTGVAAVLVGFMGEAPALVQETERGAVVVRESFPAPIAPEHDFVGAFDPSIAAGPASIFVATNYKVALMRKDGQTIAVDSLYDFVEPARGQHEIGAGDPRVLWDPFDERFLLVTQGDSIDTSCGAPRCRFAAFYVAVSKTSEPQSLTTEDWEFSLLHTGTTPGQSPRYRATYTSFSVTRDKLLIAANMFGIGDAVLHHAKLRVVPKQPLLEGRPVSQWTDFFEIPRPDSNPNPLYNIQPARHYPSESGTGRGADGSAYAVSGNPCRVVVLRVTGSASNPDLDLIEAQSSRYRNEDCETPPEVPQFNGGPALLLNGSPFNERPVFRDGSLWVVASAYIRGGSAATLRYAQVDVRDWGRPVFLQEGFVGASDEYKFVPAIAVSDAGVLVSHHTTSRDRMPGFAFTWRLHGDPIGRLRRARTVKFSRTIFHPSHDKAHLPDYSGVAVDPADGSFWVAGQYAMRGRRTGGWISNVEIR